MKYLSVASAMMACQLAGHASSVAAGAPGRTASNLASPASGALGSVPGRRIPLNQTDSCQSPAACLEFYASACAASYCPDDNGFVLIKLKP